MSARTLTPEAEAERARWKSSYGDRGCSCHISPPCGSCTHPGNPINQDEDDSAWVVLPIVEDKTRARRDDPETSKDAAASVKALGNKHHAWILQSLGQAMVSGTGGLGAEQIAAGINVTPYAARKRLSELEDFGHIRIVIDAATGKPVTRKTTTGRSERLWEMNPNRQPIATDATPENPSNLPEALGKNVKAALVAALKARGLRTDGSLLALARRCHLMALEDRDLIAPQKTLIEKVKAKIPTPTKKD